VRVALTAAYGSAYCIVRLTRGPTSTSGSTGALPDVREGDENALLGVTKLPVVVLWAAEGVNVPGGGAPNPLGAGSEKAPYTSILGRPVWVVPDGVVV
jgi:hypothetical protein